MEVAARYSVFDAVAISNVFWVKDEKENRIISMSSRREDAEKIANALNEEEIREYIRMNP